MSNIQRVYIYKGQLSPSGGPTFLKWQVFNLDGTPADFDYRGDAGFDGTNLRIASRSGVQLYDYIVAEYPTEESVLYQKGYDMGMRQNRQRCPAKQPQRVIDGWWDAWCEKKWRESYNA